jgi:DNA-binding transcriptional MerR regulator
MAEVAELLTTAQVAEATGRTVATINRWAEIGKLPRAMRVGGRGANLYHRADVEALLKAVGRLTVDYDATLAASVEQAASWRRRRT